ncbi:hypothetical protein Leucomu_03570 [Leucobacter muris]|uniref:Uncharacterized protein n=1 Tax=Leucobacter muris TaxID=1935379 RepID=A0ABX5QDI7_9MICO|nr:hypothetical protein [Leucobacter muris]QAB17121.1 hypothetical protein Leucomu_03570 [Leucobacter muris]
MTARKPLRRPSQEGAPSRGQKLSAALSPAGAELSREALAMEAGRIIDRLDELDQIIAGKGVLKLMRFRVGEIFDEDEERHIQVHVHFDNVLGEARQQANTLRQILVSLGLGKSAEQQGGQKRSSVLDELARKRAARAAGT